LVAEEQPKTQAEMDALHESLPFERYTNEGGWVWKASKLFKAQNGLVDSRFFTRRFDTDQVINLRDEGKLLLSKREGNDLAISQGGGPYRGMLDFYHTEKVKTLYAYGVGDIQRIAELLEHLEHIGSKSRLGHGRIDSIDLVSLGVDEECLWDKRPLPDDGSSQIQGYMKRFYRLTPPYWKKNDRKLSFYPV
jgi:CRISPR type IV-associated protein Csf3